MIRAARFRVLRHEKRRGERLYVSVIYRYCSFSVRARLVGDSVYKPSIASCAFALFGAHDAITRREHVARQYYPLHSVFVLAVQIPLRKFDISIIYHTQRLRIVVESGAAQIIKGESQFSDPTEYPRLCDSQRAAESSSSSAASHLTNP